MLLMVHGSLKYETFDIIKYVEANKSYYQDLNHEVPGMLPDGIEET